LPGTVQEGQDVPTATFSLAGKVAIVTGGGQGIGRKLVEALAGAGAKVMVVDLDEGRAEAVAKSVGQGAGSATPVTADVSTPDGAQKMVAAALSAYGQVDVLINNAAIFSTIKMKRFDDISYDEWKKVIDVNLTGVFLCCQAVAAPMREQRWGRIVNMSSATVLSGRPNYLHYVTSKAGIVGMTRSMARELGEDGITVNTIMPGSVETEVARDSVTEEQVRRIIAGQSVARRLTPDDITGAAIFLASDAAAAISGETVVVDGGSHFV
jgi:3-oxoacyl-[acyl-carrier protein] reductase